MNLPEPVPTACPCCRAWPGLPSRDVTPSNASLSASFITASGTGPCDACVGLGLLEKDGELYRNTPVASKYLVGDSADTLAGYILYSNQVLYNLWGDLEDAIREGTHRWRQAFGLEGPIFSHFFRNDQAMRDFLKGMHGFGRLSSPAVVRAFDLSGFHQMVDLGGGTGHLAIAACEAYPNLSAVVFDLPRVTEVAREQVAKSPAADRIDIVAGDFFEDELPGADLYAAGQILHDWPEQKILGLLRKAFARLPENGAILICEKLLNEDHTGPVPAQMQSLNMLVCTEGRERSGAEYAALLREAGFAKSQAVRTGTPLDAVMGWKRGV